MLDAIQIAERTAYIGGSDVGAIIGCNRYRSPLDVYLEKTGKVETPDLSNIEAVHFGQVLESVIADEYSRRTGLKVRRRNKTFTSKKYPWARANIDRSVDGEKMVLECKTADKWAGKNWGDEGTDEIPDSYLAQCAWYMFVLEYDRADVAALIGGNDFRIYHIDYDPVLEEMVLEKVSRFWHNNILADVPPEPINDRDLQTLYAIDNGTTIHATPDIISTIDRLARVKFDLAGLNKEKQALEFLIKKFMGKSAELIVNDSDAPLLTWKTSRPSIVLDGKALKADAPELWAQYAIERAGSRRLLLK